MTAALNPRCLRLLAGFAALSLAAPLGAQDSDMSSRMILELQQMREEVRELRGLVEAQAQEIENLKRRQRDQYLDLDRRLSALQSSGAVAAGTGSEQPAGAGGAPGLREPPGDAAGGSPAAADDGGIVATAPPRQPDPDPDDGTSAPLGGDVPEIREPSNEVPEVATLADPGDGAVRQLEEPTQAEREAYDQAFRALRETRYADAAEGFDRFLRDHPRSEFAPNALYWLGEVYYVTRDFETALDQFRKLQSTYPNSGKQPDALLKIGFSHYELGQWERARAALEQVIAEYPGTNYSRLAENRLRTMRLEGNL
jgi:tol-pal system protein YbgF